MLERPGESFRFLLPGEAAQPIEPDEKPNNTFVAGNLG